MHDREKILAELSIRQIGLVTRGQLLGAGYSSSAIDRRLGNGDLEVAFPRVYRLRGAPPSHWQQLLGACLSLGPGVVASHRSAAWLWGLDGFSRPPFKHELWAPRGGPRAIEGFTVHQLRGTHPEGYTLKHRVPTTVLERTLLDLASFLHPAPLEIALDSAARGRPEFFLELDEFLAGTKTFGREGIGRLAKLVAIRKHGEATGSRFETDLFRLLRSAKLPEAHPQYPIFATPEHPLTVVDFAFPDQRIALYLDGGSFHQARRRARLDAWQRMTLVALGWKPVVVMPSMIEDPDWIASFARMFPPPPQYELWPRPSR